MQVGTCSLSMHELLGWAYSISSTPCGVKAVTSVLGKWREAGQKFKAIFPMLPVLQKSNVR